MKIDWNALKNNKALNIAFIIFVPTIIVGAVYGVKYYNKRKKENAEKLITEIEPEIEKPETDSLEIKDK